jgi:hypothetical protein
MDHDPPGRGLPTNAERVHAHWGFSGVNIHWKREITGNQVATTKKIREILLNNYHLITAPENRRKSQGPGLSRFGFLVAN